MKIFDVRASRCVVTLLLSMLAVACAASSQVVDHAFGFNAISDSPDIEILDYRYGDSRHPTARNPQDLARSGKSIQSAGINGPMLLGDSLYVKWRVKSTGAEHQDTVDLSKRLPGDITGHRLYFIVKGSQLYVYLITPERRPVDSSQDGPRVYQHLRTITIYPD